MTWLTDPKGCGKCNYCGMDMTMDPYCAHPQVAPTAFGLDINRARCPAGACGPQGKYFKIRKTRGENSRGTEQQNQRRQSR